MRTGAERYLARRLDDADYRTAYETAKARIERDDAARRKADESAD